MAFCQIYNDFPALAISVTPRLSLFAVFSTLQLWATICLTTINTRFDFKHCNISTALFNSYQQFYSCKDTKLIL